MATDKKITELTAVTSPTSSDPLVIVNAAETKQITLTNLMAAQVCPGKFTAVESSGAVLVPDDGVTMGEASVNATSCVRVGGTNAIVSGTSQYGVYVAFLVDNPCSNQAVAGSFRHTIPDETFTIPSMIGVEVLGPSGTFGNLTVTSQYGILIGAQQKGSTNIYGLWVSDCSGASNSYSIYTNAGQVRIGDDLFLSNAAGPSLLNQAATSTVPTVVPNRADGDTGMGWQADDSLSLIAGGVEGIRITESGGSVTTTITGEKKDAVCYVVEATVDVATGDGACYFTIGDALNGKDLVDCHARVITAGTTGTTDIQVARYRSSWVDMLSTVITIDSGELGSEDAATPFQINTSNDDVSEHDLIRIDVDAVSTTPPKGLIVRLTFQ